MRRWCGVGIDRARSLEQFQFCRHPELPRRWTRASARCSRSVRLGTERVPEPPPVNSARQRSPLTKPCKSSCLADVRRGKCAHMERREFEDCAARGGSGATVLLALCETMRLDSDSARDHIPTPSRTLQPAAAYSISRWGQFWIDESIFICLASPSPVY
jgi:hypothetical protein